MSWKYIKIGAVAQLGACLNGIQEVAGSIPASSILFWKGLVFLAEPFFLWIDIYYLEVEVTFIV